MNNKGKKKEQSSKNRAYAATKAEEILKRSNRTTIDIVAAKCGCVFFH